MSNQDRRLRQKNQGAGKAGPRPERRAGSGAAASLIAGLVALMIFALPTFVVAALGMLPTIVAFWIDRSPRKYAALCVGGVNLSGVAPYLLTLWNSRGGLYQAFDILADVYAWLVMYGAAAMGWLLYLGLPPLVGTFLKIHAEQRIGALKAEQEKLREEWGEDVTRRS